MNFFNRSSRISETPADNPPARPVAPVASQGTTQRRGRLRSRVPNEYYELKTRIHDRLLDLMDLSLLDTLDRDALKTQIKKLVEQMLIEEKGRVPLNQNERELLFTEIQDEVFGLGPLEPFLQDPTISARTRWVFRVRSWRPLFPTA